MCRHANLGVGRDGKVYLLSSAYTERGVTVYLLRTDPDGSGRQGMQFPLNTDNSGGESFVYATANAKGFVALASNGSPGQVALFPPELGVDALARCRGHFAGAAPYRVEAGAVSGRFYALAQSGLLVGDVPPLTLMPQPQIVVIGAPPDGQVNGMPTIPLPIGIVPLDFRVRETGTADDPAPVFYVLYQAPTGRHLAKIDQRGSVLWDRDDRDGTGMGGLLSAIVRPGYQWLSPDTPGGVAGGYDIADSGHIYFLAQHGTAVYRIPDDGATAPVALPLPADAPSATDAPYRELRIIGNQALLQRYQDRELFGVFTLPDPATTGSLSFVRSVLSRHDLAIAEFAEADGHAYWTAGSTVTATVTVNRFGEGAETAVPAPSWRAWIRSVGAQDHRELSLTQTDATTVQLAVPADLSGLFQLTIAPHTGPWRTGIVDEYRLRRIIEVRPAGVVGSVSISTNATYHGDFGNSDAVAKRPFNRLRYAAGEPMTVTVSVRQQTSATRQLVLRLDDVSGTSPVTIAQTTLSIAVHANIPATVTVTVPGSVTGLLRPGEYVLTTTAADLTVAAQPIELGPGRFGSGYRRVLFGDLQVTSPSSVTHFDGDDYLDAADTAAVFLERSRRLGWTLVVDRIMESRQGDLARPNPGYAPGRDDPNPTTPGITETVQRLTGDPAAVDPAKLWALTPFMDIISGYGAQGVGLRSLLLGNDTFLPLPELGPVPRTTDPVSDRLLNLAWTNQILSDYPAFDGWHWAGNWWIVEHSAHGLFGEGSLTGQLPVDPNAMFAAYHDALFKTRADGVWRPILSAWFAHAADHLPATARMLRKELLAVAEAGAGRSDLVTAYAGPGLQAFLYPPDSFAEADEVDLQNQQEQYPLMLGTPFWLDFCRRPGKAVVLHEENPNDSGTGDQVLGQAFEALMRGADTSGHAAAGNVTGAGQIPWFRQQELLPDPRCLGGGLPSMFRVLSGVLHEYGEWVAAFASADPVAILLSRRQFAVQDWHGRWPGHTGRILEAYISLLYAHIPASLVFVEDLALPGVRPITDYSAVLLVNERVELDPRALAAIRAAQAAGVPVFHDGTSPGNGSPTYDIDDSGCLDTVVSGLGSTSLGTSFGLSYQLTPKTGDYVFAQEASDFQIFTTNNNPLDPPVSWVAIAQQHLPHLTSALSGVVGTGHAGVQDGQVVFSERRHGAARIVVAVNNSIFSNDPQVIGVDNAIFRRADVLHSVRAPLTTGVTLPPLPAGAVVYDVFGGGRITQDSHGDWPIDLRHWPAAIVAVLPSPITGVSVSAAPVVSAGGAGMQEIDWTVRVVGGSDASGDVPLPVRVRVLDDSQDVLWEQRTLAPANGVFFVPVNARGRIRFEAVELVSGHAAVADSGVSVSPGASSIDLLTGPVGGGSSLVAVAPGISPGISPSVTPGSDWQPAAERLGAHLSAITLTADGKSAVISAANWDSNLYTVDLATGTPGWQSRVGHQFAYQPRTLPQGIAVVGADLTAPSEFGLHIVDPGNKGTVLRRFDLYGTTPRWFGRTGTGMTDGRPPAFATAPDGAWVASAGNLGLAVWNQDGTPLWSLPSWAQKPPTPHPGIAADVVLAALNESTLLVVDGRHISTYDAATGTPGHQLPLSTPFATVNGMATAVAVSPDGTTVAVATSHDGGRVLVLATADLTQQAVLTTRADELAWTPDGSGLITAYDTRVCRYRRDPATGWALDRCYPAADVVHNVTVAADGRIALGIEQGDLIVLDAALTPVFTADLGALPVPCWLPGGDLLTATWLGRVQRLNSAYQATWSSILRSTAPDMRTRLLAPTTAQVASVIDPGSGITPLTGPNLLTAKTSVTLDPGSPGQGALLPALPDPVPAGYQPTPKGYPWLLEEVVELMAATTSNTEAYALLVQPGPTDSPITFNAISLWDDPAHPESWLRDVRLDVRAGPGYRWRPISRLISDQAARSHLVTDPDTSGPVTLGPSGQLRLVLPPGVAGNLRLAAIALHLTA